MSVTTADVNGDGRQDLLVANLSSDTCRSDWAAANGTFASAVDIVTGSMPYVVTTADVNGDGRQDIVVAITTVTRCR